MTHAPPDWLRLKKALAVEADRGFADLQGNQYRFSEFMTLSFGQTLHQGTPDQRRQWAKLAADFAQYSEATLSQRRAAIAAARHLIQALLAPPSTPQPSRLQRTPIAQASPSAGPISLDLPLVELPSLKGRRGVKALVRLDLCTVRDALFYYPRDHIDYARQANIAELEPGETVTLIGTVKSCRCFTSPRNKQLTIWELRLRDRTGQIKLSRFYHGSRFSGRGWQKSQEAYYPVGVTAAASGLVKVNKYGLTLDNPEVEVLDGPDGELESLKIGRIVPVYPLTEGVTADNVRRAIVAALPAVEHLTDPLPIALREQYGFVDLPTALRHLHFPPDHDHLAQARRRLIFDEFFYLQLGFLRRRQERQQEQTGVVLATTGELSDRFRTLLPFQLTTAQQRVISDILQDLASETPMNRLVQGDVGSGKTVVAVFAILAALQAGYQAALMAPTEVLAEQHYRKLVEWFNLLHLPVELLTGSTGVKKRRDIHSQLYTGELPLLVGTHALIEDPVQFRQLGLVVIDEQHRFGVKQRARLLAKGQSPHVLTMTATPIPRTLSLSLHGDLDVSQIDELPPGRQAIQTTVLSAKQRPQAYDLIRRELAQGRQAYIIFPLIEESEKLDVKAATKEHDRLQSTIFPEVQVGLLHGRMKGAEKEAALRQFRDNETPIIVSTTVIEVGVDVPNATVMLIENAERFGLSQLHQLRGRVGRGSHQSYCFLMSSSKNPDSRQRLNVLEQSQDGFFIAEMDLRLRGPGEVLGTRQTGLADFALASLVDDQDVLLLARDGAEKLMLADPELHDHPSLKAELEERDRQLMGGTILN
ncbi:ATP-dependent DNA helicase RecG [Spirulina major CS-329]|uniref:ATP-dependent DNA helicase RecG n=1 Tax=Spirulina TaxID=1154 RepID=UPI00232E9B01|nr:MULTISPECIES: ATP-dependent DNA helicase RecG [Spirulina]MDB9493085.1 ATP-dependent DNA helicase RecG [Spirulina subsalsa CS-330]MDB9504952.1 ATP-dependent DNA helicase RecG [Spirulina major CS-329]